MIRIFGSGILPGISIGKAVVKKNKQIVVNNAPINEKQVKAELELFNTTITKVISEIDFMILNYAFSKEDKEILSTHKLILQDPEFKKNINHLIKNELNSLENAIFIHFKELVQLFKNMDNEYFASRASDYEDVSLRIMNQLQGVHNTIQENLKNNSILIMSDINPSSVPLVAQKGIQGICLEKGSKTSHSSIIARSLGILTIVGAERLLDVVKDNDTVILNGHTGEVIIHPDDKTLSEYRNQLIIEEKKREELQKYLEKKTISKDNIELKILSNIEFPNEIENVTKINSDGIGLFRTEFLYLKSEKIPTEEEQYIIYKDIAEKMGTKEVIIRTIDIGGDKLSKNLNIAKEMNPNLGLRGIRLCLRHPEILKTQLRAIIRASEFGNIKIMFPMIAGIDEFRAAKILYEQCLKNLKKNKIIKEDTEVSIGIMIEVPSAVLLSEWLAEECDFFSLGTNDLIQYTLAVDRNNDNVDEYYQPYHPSILRALKISSDSAQKNKIDFSICGELGSDIDFLPILTGLGYRSFSISPNMNLNVKERLCNISIKETEEIVEKLLELKTISEVQKVYFKWLKKIK